MKTLTLLLSLLLTLAAPIARATDKAADAPNIDLDIRVLSGKHLVFSTRTATRQGEQASFASRKDVAYLAMAKAVGTGVSLTPGVITAGTVITLTPTLMKEGWFSVDLTANHTDILSIDTVLVDGLEAQRPRVRRMTIKGVLTINDGQAIEIPFEEEAPVAAVHDGQASPPYILRIVASTRTRNILPAR